MAEFSIDRFKYNWRGNWSTGADYIRDDVVKVNGKSYVCIIGHTSSATFKEDQEATVPGSNPPIPQPRWVVMTSGRSYVGAWNTGTNYNIGDIVTFNGSLYVCQVAHQAGTFSTDAQGVAEDILSADQKWILIGLGQDFSNDWTTGVDYGLGAVVRYGGILYKCISPNTASANFADDTGNWEQFYVGYRYTGNYSLSTLYLPNDLVKYGGSIFRCTKTITSADDSSILLDNDAFELEFPGSQYDGDWNSTTIYNVGDIVRYGGNLYQAINNNTDSNPSQGITLDSEDSTIDWELLAKPYNFRGEWGGYSTPYRTGDIVQRGGQLFVAVRDVSISDGDGSTLDYLDEEVWERIAPGKIFSAAWTAGRIYSVGEVVTIFGSSFVCNQEHYSENNNFPGDNGSGYNYWDTLVEAGLPGGMLYVGDLLTFGLSRELAGDGSTLGDDRVAIGEQGQVLSVSNELEVFWRNQKVDSDTIFVASNGKDLDGYGRSPKKPFKTVRHACQFVEDTYTPLQPVKVQVATGRYEEVGPIIVPAGCAVVGDELRSTSIIQSGAVTGYDATYINQIHFLAVDYIATLLGDVLLGNKITPKSGNTQLQITTLPATDLNAINFIVSKITDYNNYIDFRVNSGSTNPTMTGSNARGSNERFNAGTALELTKEFLIEDAYRYLIQAVPQYTLDEEQIKKDLRYLIRGWKRDVQYDGNYGTLTAAEYIANANTGAKTKDLFRVRDTTGIRSCTIDGLLGTLNPPGVFAQYQRPTGGACVALDPGWGPADNRTWIINRSPYIQGVTNIGTACVGKRIDGLLHNGGNRSMVSNDFTQVLSDGIGAWVSDGARAELVSVFTYYCQVGYLAENGGIIRATNGNNSYGTYGSIAEGNDLNETPINVTVNNRKNEATVIGAIAGGTLDEVLAFEYGNAGEEYTEATSDIVGAGADAEVEFSDFRDGALFEARLVNTTGSGSEGGSGYTVKQSSAQVTLGAGSRIVLNTNDDTNEESEILGMRILLVQGTGIGQYGYVAAFNPGSKELTVRKESTNELGWDHVIEGYPLETDLDSTTVYRIEPRTYTTHPGFSTTHFNLPQSRTFVDSAFGDLTAFYFGTSIPAGTGGTDGVGIAPATVNISRFGTAYSVTLVNPGAGYAVGESVVVLGTTLGGATPANDLTITITGTTEDSTNSITDFTFTGTARSGRYVAIAEPNFVVYSDNGQSWTEANTTSVLNFNKLIVGNNRFIALASDTQSYEFSYDGQSWTGRTLPSSAKWRDGVVGYPNGGGPRFVIIAEDSQQVAYGSDGLNWLTANLPVGDDSSGDQWQAIAWGQGRYVVISGSQTKDVAYSSDGITWSRYNNVLPAGDYTWIKMVYGNNRFLALSDKGDVAYSVDKGATWQLSEAPSLDGSTPMAYKDIAYGQGVFVAVCDTGGVEFGDPIGQTSGPTDYVVTSEDGVRWLERSFEFQGLWKTIAFSNINNRPEWIAIADNQVNNSVARIYTGKQARVRADVTAGSFNSLKIWDPGSGYVTAPTITIIDNEFTSEVEFNTRLGNKVLAQPDFINRGNGYRASTSTITIVGNGFADIVPQESFVTLDGVPATIPGPGVQIRLTGILDENTADPDDLKLFVGVGATDLGDDGSGNGTRTVRFQITPTLKNEYNLAHATAGTLRTRYSQCRISGHDFLDIGTGNFEATNYPELYAGGAFFTAAPENEIEEIDGGRVFYVSTDQDGNFRAGELFGVNQATGIVTISAEFFDLDGLSELSLGGVRLGGTGTVVSEFSTDATFSADSNNIIPTQKAIATFLAAQLSVGGSDLETNNIVAGQVSVGTVDNNIFITGGGYLNIPRVVNLSGPDPEGNPSHIQGTIVGQMLFNRNNSYEIMQ